MRILVTNDDGIHAPGLETLERIARGLSEDVWVVAPAEENSGAGHSLSLAEPIRFRRIEARRFEVAGTPTDCVVMASRKILPGDPDLVLSGVNRGQTIADDVTYSGTIAAAMEGTQLGFKRERGNPPAGTDLWAVFNRRISVTPLHMNLTQLEAMDAVRAVLDQP